MPKPMIKKQKKQEQLLGNALSATQHEESKQKNQMNKLVLDRLLRQKRSAKYMEALHNLDAGGHVHNQDQVQKIINTLREEFPEIELGGVLIGFVSRCYLGAPYEVHTLDLSGQIIDHYKSGETLPSGLEKARSIAIRGGYEFVEVYTDCCRAISSNGTVAVIEG